MEAVKCGIIMLAKARSGGGSAQQARQVLQPRPGNEPTRRQPSFFSQEELATILAHAAVTSSMPAPSNRYPATF